MERQTGEVLIGDSDHLPVLFDEHVPAERLDAVDRALTVGQVTRTRGGLVRRAARAVAQPARPRLLGRGQRHDAHAREQDEARQQSPHRVFARFTRRRPACGADPPCSGVPQDVRPSPAPHRQLRPFRPSTWPAASALAHS